MSLRPTDWTAIFALGMIIGVLAGCAGDSAHATRTADPQPAGEPYREANPYPGRAPSEGEAQGRAAGASGGGGDLGAMLEAALLATEGCHGVEQASLASGKAVIMAWFEDKAALERWYYSPVHQRFTGGTRNDLTGDAAPMAHVPHDVPVLVLATITPKAGAANPFDVDQISIELFTPLPGGAMLGGRLTPMAIKVPHMLGADD